MKSIKQFRSNLKQFNKLLFSNSDEPKCAIFKPLIKQVCEYLLDSVNTTDQLVDIELRNTTEGIKDLFKLKLG